MAVIWIAVLIMAGTAQAAPAVKFDQRQEGDVNIRADLENFVILIIPTSNTGTAGLLDLLSKSLPGKGLLKHKHGETKRPVTGIIPTQDPAQHFIESKTAPYHVDISRTRSHLAKLHPQIGNGEVLIAHSPTVALGKSRENSVLKSDSAFEESAPRSRSARTLSIQPNEDFHALVLSSDMFVGRKFGRDKKVDNSEVRSGENLTLLGAEMDQCGPDQKRDSQGICQLIKQQE
ncbi:uncharacterized protein CBL_00052 [Carabus blaptoides fortunei]